MAKREVWERKDTDNPGLSRRSTFDPTSPTVEVSLELWREVLADLGFTEVSHG